MVITKVKQIKTADGLKRGVKYILDDAKTSADTFVESDLNFPLVDGEDGELVSRLVSGHLVSDLDRAGSEFLQLKQMANFTKGRRLDYHLTKADTVLAHHVIQSFSPDDHLTPEEVHEIGRKTALELTGGNHAFVIATHLDKGHLHNHIIFNTTNEVTLNQFRWQKGTKKKLENISDKHSDLAGAKLLDNRTPDFNHTQYSAYQKQNIFKTEIKSRLDFLLKHSVSLEDFKEKADALNVRIDFEGKQVKYRLLDSIDGKVQERNTRDDTLSKRGKYSLAAIEERVSKNEVALTRDSIKSEYEKFKNEVAQDFEMKVVIQPWQVNAETRTGIYLDIDFGIRNHGQIKIPMRMVDKRADGKFELFIKKSDFFYFLNPDKSDNNRFMRGDKLVKQLAYNNGEIVLRKNVNISKLDQLIKDFEYLSVNGITSGKQFQELRERFEQELDETELALNILDERVAKLNKITAALIDVQSEDKTNYLLALDILHELNISPDTPSSVYEKLVLETNIERAALQDKFQQIVGDYQEYSSVRERSKEAQYKEQEENFER